MHALSSVNDPKGALERSTPKRPQAGNVRYALKTPYRDGTTHVIFEPEDFIARLVALVLKPRAHLTRRRVRTEERSDDRPVAHPSGRAIKAKSVRRQR